MLPVANGLPRPTGHGIAGPTPAVPLLDPRPTHAPRRPPGTAGRRHAGRPRPGRLPVPRPRRRTPQTLVTRQPTATAPPARRAIRFSPLGTAVSRRATVRAAQEARPR